MYIPGVYRWQATLKKPKTIFVDLNLPEVSGCGLSATHTHTHTHHATVVCRG